MAELKKIMKLDQKLMDLGIIDSAIDKDYKKVHSMLNTHVRKNGKILTDDNFIKGDEALRAWLMLLHKKGASQEKLTSYLRCGLAHLSFDFIESGFSKIEIDDLVLRALKSFKKRKYHKSFFRVSAVEMKALASRKSAVKKKASAKAKSKSTPKSSAKASKKVSAKKPVVKKKAVKKSVLKKTVVKKTAVKKSPARKAAVKKTAVKKTAVKKVASVKKTPIKKKPEQVKISVNKKSEKRKAPDAKRADSQTSKLKSILNRFFE